jgi:hypothetical protein
MALLAAGFAVTLVVYSWGLEAGGEFSIGGSAALLLQPLDLLEYVAVLLGSAFARVAEGLGLVELRSVEAASFALGAIGLFGSAIFALWLMRPRSRAGPQALLALGVMAFAVAAAAAVALARLDFDIIGDPLAPRFVSWSAIFWMGVVLAVASVARGALGSAAALSIALLSLCMLPALETTREIVTKRTADAAEASLGLVLGIHDRWLATRMRILGDHDRFQRVVGRLRQDRRSFFAEPWADLPGAPLADRLAVVLSERCQGGTCGR